MKSVVVLISGYGSNLQALIDAQQAGQLDGQIVAVVSNIADAYGLERARKANIDALCVDHSAYASREEFDAALMTSLDRYQPDLIVLAGFMRILTPYFVSRYQGRMLNIHPSLLPRYKGLNTHQRAIDAGDSEHGASVHFVTPDLDDGPVVLQAKVPVFEQDNATELAQRVQEQEKGIYPLVVRWFCQGRLSLSNGKALLDNEPLGSNGYATD